MELHTHSGYTGNISASEFPGCFLPYYADPCLELAFHVPTMLVRPGCGLGGLGGISP